MTDPTSMVSLASIFGPHPQKLKTEDSSYRKQICEVLHVAPNGTGQGKEALKHRLMAQGFSETGAENLLQGKHPEISGRSEGS
jgi:hypothetical protein